MKIDRRYNGRVMVECGRAVVAGVIRGNRVDQHQANAGAFVVWFR